ncbi:retrovirus-related pol polyprotein from transposon TNT 1-94 [Tanacetum coccineum]
MMNYVRIQSHGWTIPQLKKLSFEELKVQFERTIRSIENFIPMDSKKEKESLKRSGETLHGAKKKQKVLDVKDIPIPESAKFMKEEEIDVKHVGKGYCHLIRANQRDSVFLNFGAMLHNISREDLVDLYKIVLQKTTAYGPEEDLERAFAENLRIMFDPPQSEDSVWSLPMHIPIVNWRYYDSCNVHCLNLHNTTNGYQSTMSNRHKDWLVQEQTTLGKDFSNPFMADNLPKIVWLSTHHIYVCKELASPQGYGLCIDYDETYALVARLESIRILLAYACALNFKVFQMDVKSAFLNGFINKEVYVAQPPEFIDFKKPDHVYKLKKALYGLKQAPKAWYDRLKAFLIKHEYKMGMVDNTLFTKKKSSNLILVQIYVDDIIIGSTCQDMCDEFAKIMHNEFEISMMGELNFFLVLQIKQMEDGIFFNQSKYIKEMFKKFGLDESKPMKTLMSSDTTKDKECESVDSTKYRGMIGSLLYLTSSMPDIMFSVSLCARFQEAPKTSHFEAVKRIF